MATYDQQGNLIPEDVAYYPTINPDIVKMRAGAGPMPQYSTDAGDGYWYFPTNEALRMGKIRAAMDTFAALPAQIEQQVLAAAQAARDTVTGLPNAILWGVAAYVIFELMQRRGR